MHIVVFSIVIVMVIFGILIGGVTLLVMGIVRLLGGGSRQRVRRAAMLPPRSGAWPPTGLPASAPPGKAFTGGHRVNAPLPPGSLLCKNSYCQEVNDPQARFCRRCGLAVGLSPAGAILPRGKEGPLQRMRTAL